MSYPLYPLTAYTYFDPSVNNFLPVTNSTFVYGTLGPCNWTGLTTGYTTSSTNYGSLDISSNGLYGNTQLVSLYNYATDASGVARNTIQANQSGIYRLKTTLSFTGLQLLATSNLVFLLTNLYAINEVISASNFLLLDVSSNPIISSLTKNQTLSFGYMWSNVPATTIPGSPSGNITFNTTSAPQYYNPYYNVYSSAASGSFTNSGICVVEVILYLQQNNPLYFNIQFQNGTSSYLNATGNFELELLYAIPNTSNPQNIKSLSNYTYTNTSIEYPITNTNFLYGTLGPCAWIVGSAGNPYTAYNTNYGSLTVTSLYGNAGLTSTQTAPNTTNAGLARLVTMTNTSGVTGYSLSIIQSGIYRLRTTLSFSGSGFGSGVQLLALVLTSSPLYNVSLSTQLPINYSKPTSITTSEYLSLGYLFSNPGGTSSSSTRPYYEIDTTTTTPSVTYPTIFLENTPISGSSSTFTNNGISVAEVILYLYGNPTTNSGGTTTLFFNISPSGGSNYLNATGNFMLELLCAT